jgi:hypothetical protein
MAPSAGSDGFEQIKPGARLRGLDPAGIAEVVSVSNFGNDAINLVFRVDGRVAERLVYRGEPGPLHRRNLCRRKRIAGARRQQPNCSRSTAPRLTAG